MGTLLNMCTNYVARYLCIFMKEVGWNPDRTVMNENSIRNFVIQIFCT